MQTSEKTRIAIIDDNEDNRLIFRTYLEEVYNVVEFADGEKAIADMKAAFRLDGPMGRLVIGRIVWSKVDIRSRLGQPPTMAVSGNPRLNFSRSLIGAIREVSRY